MGGSAVGFQFADQSKSSKPVSMDLQVVTSERSVASRAEHSHVGLLAQLDTSLGGLSSEPSTAPPDAKSLSREAGKADLCPAKRARVLPTTPTKRQSSLVFVGVASDGLQEGAQTPPLSKHVKLEPIKSPLAFVDANTGLMATDAVQPACSLLAHNQHHNHATMAFEGHPVFVQEAHMQTFARQALENSLFDSNFLLPNDIPFAQGVASGSQMAFGQTGYQWAPPNTMDTMDTDEELNYLLSGLTDPPLDSDRNIYGGGREHFAAPPANPDK